MTAISYLWSDIDLDGMQFCATHGCGEIVAVHDAGTYAELYTCSDAQPRVEHYSTAEQARRAGETHLWNKGITP